MEEANVTFDPQDHFELDCPGAMASEPEWQRMLRLDLDGFKLGLQALALRILRSGPPSPLHFIQKNRLSEPGRALLVKFRLLKLIRERVTLLFNCTQSLGHG
jgi:hypothetical protein